MKSLVDQLKPIALFRGLSDEELLLMATCMKSSEISKGRVLFRMGELSDAAYIVRTGELSAYLQTENQVQEIVKFGAGSVFGELCLVKEGARALTIRANADTELWRIDRGGFSELRTRKASAAYKLIRNICVTACDRLRTTNQFIEVEVQQGAHFVQWTGAQPKSLSNLKQKIKSLFSKA
ncbi:MAG: cyclic nucleotide-binding domain-containing protein [Bradymonadia bacterium]